MSFLILNEQASAPSTPASAKVTLYVDNTANPILKFVDDNGLVVNQLDDRNTVTATNKTFTTPTLTTPLISAGLTASGSGANDFSASTGTFKTSTGANTLSGATTMAATKALTLAAGTATAGQAPLYFVSGTNLTAAAVGAVEFDGTCFYSTPVASARGLSPSTMFSIVPAGDFTLATTSGVQAAFPTTGDVWTLAATTAYFFEGTYYITHSTTTCTCAMAFATGGGASITSIYYTALSVINAADGAPAAPVMTWVDTNASTVVTATSTVGWAIRFQGILRMNAAGTITPQVNWSANTTAPVMKVNSYIKFTPLGTNTTNILGNVG
jgi:hypothetical protein